MRLPGPIRLRRWSIARQLLALQVVLLVLVIGGGGLAVLLRTREEVQSAARERVTVLARSLAVSPYVRAQVRTAHPATSLQPYAEGVRTQTGVDFVVIMAPDRTRYSHPNPALIGHAYVGTIAPALAGRTFTETFTGSLGPSIRAVAPVLDGDGHVIALVSVGVTTQAIGHELARQLPLLALVVALALAVAVLGALLVSRRLRRQTHGLGTAEIRRMYEYYDAVLHSVREGLVLVDRRGAVQLVNDEARRLLDLDVDVGAPADALPVPASLRGVLSSGRETRDELHLVGDRVLVVNQVPAHWDAHLLGTVATFRDRTELVSLTGELDVARAFAESLRSQAHESANRLHTVVSLLELGRAQDAVNFATEELAQTQELIDRVVASIEEPVLAALLLGKTSQAAERGVELTLTPDSTIGQIAVPARDLVTLVGNLVDNAIDAAADGKAPRRVLLTFRRERDDLLVEVADTGCGLEESQAREAFRRGWTTKPDSSSYGRGLGLALVGQVVRRYGGEIEVRREVGAVFAVRLPLDDASRRVDGAS